MLSVLVPPYVRLSNDITASPYSGNIVQLLPNPGNPPL